MLRALIGIPAALALISAAPALDEPRTGAQSTIQSRCEALLKEFGDAYQKWYGATHIAKTNEEAQKFQRPDGGAYAARFMALAREHPDDPGAVDALNDAIQVDPLGPSPPEAIELLRARHVKSPRIGRALQTIAFFKTLPAVEPLLRAVRKENPDAAVRGDAALALAGYLRSMAKEANYLAVNADAYRRAIELSGEAAVKRVKDRDPEAMLREAETLLESVSKQLDVPYNDRQSLGERAATILHEMRALAVGKPAPEIEGKDVDGKPMKLSDHRGKVVVLVWWATWCGQCMVMVPHERDIVGRMEGKPFVMLGINGDESREPLEHQTEEQGVAWRSWYDGGPDGPISTRWNVTGWPTIYVLDRDGVIRYKGDHDEKGLDDAIEKLLPEG